MSLSLMQQNNDVSNKFSDQTEELSFVKTIKVAIKTFREFLRKNLDQPQRLSVLNQLGLKSPSTYESEYQLYCAAKTILHFIKEELLKEKDSSYYSYSGIDTYYHDLEKYLSMYVAENHRIVHRGQKASRAILEAIQMASTPNHSSAIAQKLYCCNEIVVEYGSEEQQKIYLENLIKLKNEVNASAYEPVLNSYQEILSNFLNRKEEEGLE